MALNHNPERITLNDLPALQSQHRAIADHLDDGYYVWRLSPSDFAPDPVFPGVAVGTLGSFQTLQFPDAVTSVAVFNRDRPLLWVAGKLRLDVAYTSPAAGTANFTCNFQVETLTKAGNVTAPTNLGPGGGLLLPGPAVASDRKLYTGYTTSSLAGDADLVGLRFFRSGGTDANNNRLDIITVKLTFIPAVQQVHVG